MRTRLAWLLICATTAVVSGCSPQAGPKAVTPDPVATPKAGALLAQWRVQKPIRTTIRPNGGGFPLATIRFTGQWSMKPACVRHRFTIVARSATRVSYRSRRPFAWKPYRISVVAAYVVDWRSANLTQGNTGSHRFGDSKLGLHWSVGSFHSGDEAETEAHQVFDSSRRHFSLPISRRGEHIPLRNGALLQSGHVNLTYVLDIGNGAGVYSGGLWGSREHIWSLRRSCGR